MSSGEIDFTRERKVVANEYTGTGDDPSRKRFVMAVPKAEHPTIVRVGTPSGDFHETEVPVAFVAEAVGVRTNLETVRQ